MAVLALNAVLTGMLVVLFVVISVMMMLVVLIQRPSGGGLSGAFGSASEGAGQTAFGAKTGDALTTATIVIFVLFLVCAVGLNYALVPPDAVPAPGASSPDGTTAPIDDTPAAPADSTVPPPTQDPAPTPAEQPPAEPAPAPTEQTPPSTGSGTGG